MLWTFTLENICSSLPISHCALIPNRTTELPAGGDKFLGLNSDSDSFLVPSLLSSVNTGILVYWFIYIHLKDPGEKDFLFLLNQIYILLNSPSLSVIILWFIIRNIYLVFVPISGTELLNPWHFLKDESIKLPFVMLMRGLLDSTWRCRLVARKGLELSVSPPGPPGRGEGLRPTA